MPSTQIFLQERAPDKDAVALACESEPRGRLRCADSV